MKLVAVSMLVLCQASVEWEEFKASYGKVYESDVEEEHRSNVFKQNLDFIEAENAKGHPYSLGVTDFTDLTNDEFSKLYVGASLPDQSDEELPFLGNHSFSEEYDLPSSVDWSMRGAVTGVKNQGQCGSCWAFSGVGALEGAHQIASGRLVSLSEQQMVDCDGFPNMGCKGGHMSTVYGHAKTHGACTEGSYRYAARNGNCREANCALGVSKHAVKGFRKAIGERGLMSAVVQQPVSVAIQANKPIFQHYRGGVLTGACGSLTDHGVLVVGYGTSGGLDFWKVKNSWGGNWGSRGYVLLKRGGAGLKGECGILSSPTYPVMASASDIVV